MPGLDEIEARKLYNAIPKNYNIGTWEEFSAKMQTPEQRKNFFDAISVHLNIGDYNTFENRLKKKEDFVSSGGTSRYQELADVSKASVYGMPKEDEVKIPFTRGGVEQNKIDKFYEQNKDVPWVKRIMSGDSRMIQDPYNSKNYSTHLMSSGEMDGKYYVFPEILDINGKLVYKPDLRLALKLGEAIEVKSDEEARYIAENGYKQSHYWTDYEKILKSKNLTQPETEGEEFAPLSTKKGIAPLSDMDVQVIGWGQEEVPWYEKPFSSEIGKDLGKFKKLDITRNIEEEQLIKARKEAEKIRTLQSSKSLFDDVFDKTNNIDEATNKAKDYLTKNNLGDVSEQLLLEYQADVVSKDVLKQFQEQGRDSKFFLQLTPEQEEMYKRDLRRKGYPERAVDIAWNIIGKNYWDEQAEKDRENLERPDNLGGETQLRRYLFHLYAQKNPEYTTYLYENARFDELQRKDKHSMEEAKEYSNLFHKIQNRGIPQMYNIVTGERDTPEYANYIAQETEVLKKRLTTKEELRDEWELRGARYIAAQKELNDFIQSEKRRMTNEQPFLTSGGKSSITGGGNYYDKISKLQSNVKQAGIDFDVASRAYLLNESPSNIIVSKGKTAIRSLARTSLGMTLGEQVEKEFMATLKPTERELLNIAEEMMSKRGIEPTEAEKKNFERSWGEEVAEMGGSILGLIPILGAYDVLFKTADIPVLISKIKNPVTRIIAKIFAEETKMGMVGFSPGVGGGFVIAKEITGVGRIKLPGRYKIFEPLINAAIPATLGGTLGMEIAMPAEITFDVAIDNLFGDRKSFETHFSDAYPSLEGVSRRIGQELVVNLALGGYHGLKGTNSELKSMYGMKMKDFYKPSSRFYKAAVEYDKVSEMFMAEGKNEEAEKYKNLADLARYKGDFLRKTSSIKASDIDRKMQNIPQDFYNPAITSEEFAPFISRKAIDIINKSKAGEAVDDKELLDAIYEYYNGIERIEYIKKKMPKEDVAKGKIDDFTEIEMSIWREIKDSKKCQDLLMRENEIVKQAKDKPLPDVSSTETPKPAEPKIEEALPRYSIEGKEYNDKEEFIAEVKKIKAEGRDVKSINIENDETVLKQVEDILREKSVEQEPVKPEIEEALPRYSIEGKEYNKEEFIAEIEKAKAEGRDIKDFKVENDEVVQKQVEDILGKKAPELEKPIEPEKPAEPVTGKESEAPRYSIDGKEYSKEDFIAEIEKIKKEKRSVKNVIVENDAAVVDQIRNMFKKKSVKGIKTAKINTPVEESFEQKYKVSEIDIANALNEQGKDGSFESAYEKVTGKELKGENNQMKIDFINAINKKGIKLKNKIDIWKRTNEKLGILEYQPKKTNEAKNVLKEIKKNILKDEFRPIFKSILFEEGNMIATDGNKLVVLKRNISDKDIINDFREISIKIRAKEVGLEKATEMVDKEIKTKFKGGLDGKRLDFENGTIEKEAGEFPNYKSVIPKIFSLITEKIPIQELIDKLNGIKDAYKNLESSQYPIFTFDTKDFLSDNVAVRTDRMLDVLRVMQANGNKSIKFSFGRIYGALKLEGDKGDIGLVMTSDPRDTENHILTEPIKIQKYDSQNKMGVAGEIREGQELVETEPLKETGTAEAETGRIFQTSEKKEIADKSKVIESELLSKAQSTDELKKLLETKQVEATREYEKRFNELRVKEAKEEVKNKMEDVAYEILKKLGGLKEIYNTPEEKAALKEKIKEAILALGNLTYAELKQHFDAIIEAINKFAKTKLGAKDIKEIHDYIFGENAEKINEEVEKIVAAQNKKSNEWIEKAGLTPLFKEASKSNPEIWEETLKEIAEGKIDMNKEIVLIGTGKSQLGPLKQQSVVLAHAVKTEMEITKTREALNNKDLSNPERIKLLQDLITYEDDMLNNNLAVRKTGETWGNWGRMRQLYATMDYSLRAMIAKARVFTGGKEIQQKYIDKFTECADKLDKLANDLNKAEEKLREERETNKVKEAERRLKTQEDFIKETKKNLNKIKIKNENSIIEKIKKESEGELHDGLSSLLQKLARIKVAKGKENFNDVLDAVAEDIKEFIPDVDKEKLADLISDYRFDELTRKEIKEQIRALKIMLSKHKEMKGKPMTKEQKDMQRVIKERARKLGVKPGVTDEQIKEQWEAKANDYLKKLEDSIADIQKELDARIKKAKGKEYDDPITNELKERLKNKIEERDALLNKDNLTEEQKIDRVIENINKTISDIEKAIRLINEDKKNPNVEFIEKGDKRIEVSNTTVDNLREEKERLTAERDALSPKETKEQAEYNAYVKGLNRRLKYYKNKLEQLKSGTYAPRKTKKIPQLAQNDEQVKKIQMEIMKTRDESDMIVEKIRLQNRKTTEKILDGFLQWWNLTKALVASWDVSAPGRQGVFFITKVPIFMKSFAKMFSFAFSKKQFDNYMYAAKSDPEYEIMTKKYKLGLTFPTTKMTAQEELFSTHLINVVKNIPVYGWGISASERAFVGFLNKLRMDLYYNYKSKLEKIPMTQEQFDKEMESFVHLINIGTGRSHLGKRDNAIQILNSVLFAPRFALSRFEIAGMLLSPRTWSSKTPEYRKEALKQWFSYMGTVSLTLFLLKQAFGDDIEIEIDPRSSDFGRIVYKGVRYDLWGGILQPYRLVTQVGLGERKNVMTGEITDLRNKRKYPFALPTNVLFQYWGNKIHPSLNVLFTFINNYNQFTGEEFDVTKEWMELVVPILIQELVKIAEEEGIEEIPLPATLSMFGIGVNYYKPKKKGKGKTQPRP